jgi:hypothetical protein
MATKVYLEFILIKYILLFFCIRWFRLIKHDPTGQEVWVSNEKYWERNWADCPDIY